MWYILSIKINIFWKFSVAFSAKGTKIVSGSHDYTIKVWESENYTLLQTIQGHTDRVVYINY